jgi:hypothetical protein
MVYNLAFAMLSSLKLLFFKSLTKCVALLGQRGSLRPRNPIRAFYKTSLARALLSFSLPSSSTRRRGCREKPFQELP